MEKPWLAHYEPIVPQSLSYPNISLPELLERSVRQFPAQPALRLILRYLGPLSIGGRMSYRQLGAEVDRCAAALHALGVRKGDRVALMLPNLPQFVICFFGALKVGAIVVNTNPQYTGREIERQFSDAGVETAVMLSALYNRLEEVRSRTPVKRVVLTDLLDYASPLSRLAGRWAPQRGAQLAPRPSGEGVYHLRPLLASHPGPPPRVAIAPDDTALFQYTGGTTGIPKAAMLTHRNLVVNTVQMRHWITPIEMGRERVLGALPFFHVYGMTVGMLLGIHVGAELILLPVPRPTELIMQTIHRYKATIYPGVPTMYIGIINHRRVGRYNLRSVKACISGAAPLPMEVQVKFGQLTGGRLVEGYGLTEASPVTHCNPVRGECRAGSIGLPLPDVEARIMDYERLVEQPVGEAGELWVRGPQVMAGYWNRPEETARTITPDGWLRTGDIARMDADGYFYLIDRLKDIIITSGFNVIPREVEEVLYEHPKVQEAVVAGVPDPYRGEMVKAYVVLKPGQSATAEEIIAFCAERLAPYKVPRQVEFRRELPKTAVGKFLRRALVEEEKEKLARV